MTLFDFLLHFILAIYDTFVPRYYLYCENLAMALTFLSTTVLHPQYKLQYFRNAGWETEWITTAEHLVREIYDQSYAARTVAEGVNARDNVSFMSLMVRHDLILLP